MNIVFFLTPKREVIYVKLTSTVRQVLEKMKYHNCNRLPILDDKGVFVGIITKEDLISKIKNSPKLEFKDFNKMGISDIITDMIDMTVHIYDNIDDLPTSMLDRSFVPVVDDSNIFIGIIKKSDLLSMSKYNESEKLNCM
ncbi:CBS domain-containing protein [Clostridium acidisoli DSM 12555]|jgi:CBS-domain-containing membrane protein|uniref:CBS domain-containing protein n=1 Tax=Clostridium acidisoli DSM 12555 TaxID=1121291 RepID=A0A1W1XLJ2_9CLOT|nr:CBS domain-containing protein [Clostridium acidisoli]SMC24687.1 CBS domain-containing protein [Clostridium acidisoli DSM 12555]